MFFKKLPDIIFYGLVISTHSGAASIETLGEIDTDSSGEISTGSSTVTRSELTHTEERPLLELSEKHQLSKEQCAEILVLAAKHELTPERYLELSTQEACQLGFTLADYLEVAGLLMKCNITTDQQGQFRFGESTLQEYCECMQAVLPHLLAKPR